MSRGFARSLLQVALVSAGALGAMLGAVLAVSWIESFHQRRADERTRMYVQSLLWQQLLSVPPHRPLATEGPPVPDPIRTAVEGRPAQAGSGEAGPAAAPDVSGVITAEAASCAACVRPAPETIALETVKYLRLRAQDSIRGAPDRRETGVTSDRRP